MNVRVISPVLLFIFVSLFLLPLFIPSTMVSARSNAIDSCSYVQWYAPGAQYPNPPATVPQGEQVAAAISTSCAGVGTYSFTYYGPTGTSTPTIIFHGPFSCPSRGCNELVLFSTTALSPGLYVFVGSFPNAPTTQTRLQVTSLFVTPQFPLGSILAVAAPLSAFGLYALSKRFSLIRK